MILTARALLAESGAWHEGGGIELRNGRIVRLLRSPRAVARARGAGARVRDLGPCVLTAGLVNAHAHLELDALGGKLGTRGGFAGWVGELLRARAGLTRAALELGVRAGARALLASGTTSVGDIDSTGTSARLAARLSLGLVVYRELLDAWDPARTAPALATVARRLAAGALVREGLAPHAPYTTSRELLAGARALARRRALALTIHWAETEAEAAWLEHGRGPLARILPRSPRASGLALLGAAGLLTRRTSLVHGNHPRADEPERLARAGVTLVHCPGTHAYFARAPFPLERYRRAGVALALGTDSRASNAALDLRREMALLRANFPRLAPAEVFAMATVNGARALGLAREVGSLGPGRRADVVAWSLAAARTPDALDELTGAEPPVAHVFVAGRERL